MEDPSQQVIKLPPAMQLGKVSIDAVYACATQHVHVCVLHMSISFGVGVNIAVGLL